MAKGPTYKLPPRRRREGKTNYHSRKKLLMSRKNRLIIRASNKNIIVQFIQSKLGGDFVLTSAFSKELVKGYGWQLNTGNLPAAYLTGYIAGIRAKKKKINDSILDLGLMSHFHRQLAAFKGILDAGIEIPHKEFFFPQGFEERINGTHIQNYAKLLAVDDEQYKLKFSSYLKMIDPLKITSIIDKTLKEIKRTV
ncbi:MAG: 50S ribosomal protein L18 [Candidatus Lokiarchaeota archaeon]|nr:50S ribosomal protein L18 [Candidatus Lokiarchaeota archaeon]